MQCLWPVVVLCLISSSSLAILVNVTIDDTLGDSETRTNITYIGEWNVGPSCSHCTSTKQLDLDMIHEGTWHDSSANKKPFDINQQLPLAFVPFNGTAVYVYCIIANTMDKPIGNVDITFLIDGQLAGAYIRQPRGEAPFDYNVLVFSTDSLSPERHTLTIQNGHIGGARSLVLLDYIVYSYDNGLTEAEAEATFTDTATDHSSPATYEHSEMGRSASSSGKIVGCVLGSIGVLLLVLVVFLWKRQQRRKACPKFSREHRPRKSPRSFTSKWMSINPRRKSASFNPSLFVELAVNTRNRTIVSHVHPTTVSPVQLLPQRPDYMRPLEPDHKKTPSPSLSGLDARNEQRQPLSILEWQRQTQREANDKPPRFDVSDHHEMSSYYDFSSEGLESPVAKPSPPRPSPRSAPRRFTVVNN